MNDIPTPWDAEFEEVAKHSYDDADFSYMRSFIKKLLLSHTESLVKEIEGLRAQWQNDRAFSINETLDSVLEIIRRKK